MIFITCLHHPISTSYPRIIGRIISLVNSSACTSWRESISFEHIGRDVTFRSYVPSPHRKMRSCFIATSSNLRRLTLRRPSRFSNSRRSSRRYIITKVRHTGDITPKHIMNRDRPQSGEEDVYVGSGKVIRDDPKKYPSKEDAGFLQGKSSLSPEHTQRCRFPAGATGGWAGGEPGLQKFVDTLEERELPATTANDVPDTRPATKPGSGDDRIYVGFDYKRGAILK